MHFFNEANALLNAASRNSSATLEANSSVNDDDDGMLAVTFTLAGVHIQTKETASASQDEPSHSIPASELLDAYAESLATRVDSPSHPGTPRAAGEPSSTSVCANMLLTHTHLSGGSLGIAKYASACTSKFERGVGGGNAHVYRARNVAAVTTHSDGHGDQEGGHRNVPAVVAHELLHLVGASHDCCMGNCS